jgi:hypothetical protein
MTIFANPGQQFSTQADSNNIPSNRLEQSVFLVLISLRRFLPFLIAPIVAILYWKIYWTKIFGIFSFGFGPYCMIFCHTVFAILYDFICLY